MAQAVRFPSRCGEYGSEVVQYAKQGRADALSASFTIDVLISKPWLGSQEHVLVIAEPEVLALCGVK